MRRSLILGFCLYGTVQSQPSASSDEFLHSLYDRLHDSPTQRKFRELAPLPVGVVFLPWAGMTEAEMRAEFRTMKKLGFHNLKQAMGTPEWPEDKVLAIALEEGVIPFWYGEGGWERVTPELLDKLGIPRNASKAEIRKHPKMLAYQKEVLRRGIGAKSGQALLAGERYQHTPDPFLRDHDVTPFAAWLRSIYKTPEAVSRAWNAYEVGIDPPPFQSWSDVEKYLAILPQDERRNRQFGREYGRTRDILQYKAETHALDVLARSEASVKANPHAPTRTGGEMGLFLPFAWRATKMEDLAQTQLHNGSFYPSIHFAWHYGEVHYEVARPLYMQSSFATDLFKGGWTGGWESTGGPQQLTGGKGWDYPEQSTTAGFTVNAGTMTQLLLSFFAGGMKGAGLWTWNFRRAGWEGGEFALTNRQGRPTERAIRAGQIAQAAERHRDELWAAHKEPYVGLLLNWDSDAIWAAASVRGRDHFKHYAMNARVGASRALIDANIPWEHVTPDDLRAGLAGRYKVIWLAGQIALNEDLLRILLDFAEKGGRVVLDAPGGWYDERGHVLSTAAGTTFEKLFGVELADFQYSNNVPRSVGGVKLASFVTELAPTRAKVVERFSTGEPAVTEAATGKGTAVVMGFAGSIENFKPGHAVNALLPRFAMGAIRSPYACDGAIAYRLAAPGADHYFLINDGDARTAKLSSPRWSYSSAIDAMTQKPVTLDSIALEPHSGRWLRATKRP